MRLGLIGCGPFGKVYHGVLEELGIEHWWAGRDWASLPDPDGLIIASATDSHFPIARWALAEGIPVLVEKPVCANAWQARELVKMGGIAFAGHTRLYDPSWRFLKALGTPERVEAWAGGVNEGNPDERLNWLAHLVPMCLDLGFDPAKAVFHITKERQKLRFLTDKGAFTDTSGALKALVGEFVRAIERGELDNSGLQLGLKALEFMEKQSAEMAAGG